MNAQVRFLLAFDCQHADQHDQPLRILAGFTSFTVPVEFGKFGLLEKLQKVRSRLLNPPLRNHAAGPLFLHVASLPPLGDNILPSPGYCVKLRDPSVNSRKSKPTPESLTIHSLGMPSPFFAVYVNQVKTKQLPLRPPVRLRPDTTEKTISA